MTAQPHPSIRLRRAIDQGNVFLAEIAARDMGRLSLQDSLSLVVLYARCGDPKFERASARWLSRVIEERSLSTQQVALAANALLELRGTQARHGAQLLGGLAGTRREPKSPPGGVPPESRSRPA